VIETHAHAALVKSREQVVGIRSYTLSTIFRLLSPGLVAKTLLQNNCGRPFEDEDTNSKHQYGSVRLAPSQKEHKRRHNS
jgi:hypothetical protein